METVGFDMEKVLDTAYDEDSQMVSEDGYYTFSCHSQTGKKGDIMAPAHWHYYVELIYLVEGEVTVSLNGRLFKVREHELIVINAREVHAIWGQAETKYICIKFDPEILYTSSHSILETRYVLPFTTVNSQRRHVFTKLDMGDMDMYALVCEIQNEFESRQYGFELAVKTNICRIFLWILRLWKSDGDDVGRNIELKEKDVVRLDKAITILDRQYMHEITAEEVAAQCNMSYSYFSRFFKMAVGRSFTKYLNEIRLSEAEKLLITTDKSVTEVAMETGFSSISYFISQFRENRYLSPLQFRRKLRESALIQDDTAVLRATSIADRTPLARNRTESDPVFR